MHHNSLLRDIFVFTNTVRLYFCISDEDRQVFHGDTIIVIRVFFFHIYSTTVNAINVFNR